MMYHGRMITLPHLIDLAQREQGICLTCGATSTVEEKWHLRYGSCPACLEWHVLRAEDILAAIPYLELTS